MTSPLRGRPGRKPGAVMPAEMPGTARQIVLQWGRLPRTSAVADWPGDSEIRLSASPMRDVYLCALPGSGRYEVAGKTEADRRALREIRFGTEPYIAVTAHSTRPERHENFSVRVHAVLAPGGSAASTGRWAAAQGGRPHRGRGQEAGRDGARLSTRPAPSSGSAANC